MAPRNLFVVIPAAGLGRRMKSWGPKPLIQLEGETVLGRQIRLLTETFGIRPDQIVVVTGYEADRVKKSLPRGVRSVYNPLYETTNVAYSVELGLHSCLPGVPVLVVYGDLVFDRATLACMNHESSAVLVDNRLLCREEEVGVNIVKGKATNFSFGLPDKWGHMLLMHWAEQRLFMQFARQAHRQRHFVYEILNEAIEAGGNFAAVSPALIHLAEIDSSKDIESARKIR